MSDPTRDQLAFFIRAITCCHGRVQHTHVEDPELEQELADALMPMFASLQRDLAEARATIQTMFTEHEVDESTATERDMLRRVMTERDALRAALLDMIAYAAQEIGLEPEECVGGHFTNARAALASGGGAPTPPPHE